MTPLLLHQALVNTLLCAGQACLKHIMLWSICGIDIRQSVESNWLIYGPSLGQSAICLASSSKNALSGKCQSRSLSFSPADDGCDLWLSFAMLFLKSPKPALKDLDKKWEVCRLSHSPTFSLSPLYLHKNTHTNKVFFRESVLLRQGYNCSVKMGHMIKHFVKQGTVKLQPARHQHPKWGDSTVALRSESWTET